MSNSALALAAAVTLLAPAVAAAEPPANDDYAAATSLNAPGSPLTRDAVTSPPTATAQATVQAELFSPGGPPEPTECGADRSAFGRTVWWRVFPDVGGRLSVQAVGYDTAVALVPFASPASPLPQGYTCANNRDDTIEALSEPVEAGRGYAIQVGGVAGAAGTLQVTVSFLPDRDGDGVLDEDDRCPTRAGTVGGCPPQIVARASYDYAGSARGATLQRLVIRDAPKGARIAVRCNRGCASHRVRFRAPVTSLRRLTGRAFPNGARIDLRITKAGYAADHLRLRISGGRVTSSHVNPTKETA